MKQAGPVSADSFCFVSFKKKESKSGKHSGQPGQTASYYQALVVYFVVFPSLTFYLFIAFIGLYLTNIPKVIIVAPNQIVHLCRPKYIWQHSYVNPNKVKGFLKCPVKLNCVYCYCPPKNKFVYLKVRHDDT